jgi:hypothetical protein
MHDFGFDHETNFFIKRQTPGGNFFSPNTYHPRWENIGTPPLLVHGCLNIRHKKKKKQIAMITK